MKCSAKKKLKQQLIQSYKIYFMQPTATRRKKQTHNNHNNNEKCIKKTTIHL